MKGQGLIWALIIVSFIVIILSIVNAYYWYLVYSSPVTSPILAAQSSAYALMIVNMILAFIALALFIWGLAAAIVPSRKKTQTEAESSRTNRQAYSSTGTGAGSVGLGPNPPPTSYGPIAGTGSSYGSFGRSGVTYAQNGTPLVSALNSS